MGDHGASMGMRLAFGQQRGAHDTRDYLNSKMVVLWGRNVADTHTSEYRYLVKARENGAKIVVVDPRLCSSCAIADQWIPVKAQTDPALALGMMNVIIAHDLHAKDWLAKNSVAPFLVKESDGSYLMDGERWLVWDEAAGAPAPFDKEGVQAALSGTFDANGEACRTAFDHLADEVAKYTLDHHGRDHRPRPGRHRDVRPGVRPGAARRHPHGPGHAARVELPSRPSAPWPRWPPWRATSASKAAARRHAGGTASIRSTPGVTIPAFDYEDWANTGENKANLVKSSTHLRADRRPSRPVSAGLPVVRELELREHEPGRPTASSNEVLPCVSTIVTVDPYWTWTAKYSDYVLPACNYWEKWDFLDRSPLGVLRQPCRHAGRREQVRRGDHVACWPRRWGWRDSWNKTDEEWVRSFVNAEHPAWEGFDFDQAVADGIWARTDGILRRPASSSPTACSPRPPAVSSSCTTTTWWRSRKRCPATSPCWRTRRAELGREVPAGVPAVPRPPERAHAAHPDGRADRRCRTSRCSR